MQCAIGNAVEFGPTTLKCLTGTLPKQISGDYFRNGPGQLSFDNEVDNHWFNGDGCILKLGFKSGECSAQLKFVDTYQHRRRAANKSFKMGLVKQMWSKWKDGSQYRNQANTSVLCLKNSPDLLALCQGGQPFILKKQDLKSEGFSNYGWMNSAFSAHPKVDPQNGDIYNIGMSIPNMTVMRATKDMKKICSTQFKLRQIQSIHDFCLAGDYIIILQAPIRFHLKDMLWSGKFFYDCLSLDSELPTLVHIYKKHNLQHVDTLKFEPFYTFHFTNGYSTQQKIVLQYVRYDIQSAKNLFKLVSDAPKYTNPAFNQEYKGQSKLEQLTINLKEKTLSSRHIQINGEFPVCQDSQVGKQWRYTYIVGSEEDNLLRFDTLMRYDRKSEKIDKIKLEGNVHINQPALIRGNDGKLYVLCVVNRDKQSFVQLFDGQSLKEVCQLALPEFVPAGFHGKWDITE